MAGLLGHLFLSPQEGRWCGVAAAERRNREVLSLLRYRVSGWGNACRGLCVRPSSTDRVQRKQTTNSGCGHRTVALARSLFIPWREGEERKFSAICHDKLLALRHGVSCQTKALLPCALMLYTKQAAALVLIHLYKRGRHPRATESLAGSRCDAQAEPSCCASFKKHGERKGFRRACRCTSPRAGRAGERVADLISPNLPEVHSMRFA